MKLNKVVVTSSVLALMLSLSSCAEYAASPLRIPFQEVVQSSQKNEGVSIISKAFTRQDCNLFLGRDILSEGYQPIQIYIQNDSDRSYIFSLNRITLPIARPEEVAELVHTSTVGRIVGYGAGSLVFWPLVVPAIVDGVMSSKANDALDNDFFAKAAKNQIVLQHSQLNAIIFVPIREYQASYTLTLIDQNSGQPKTFHVAIDN